VSERIVDDLEAIEVEDEYGHVGPVASAAAKCMLDAIQRQRSVRQSGQWVMHSGVPTRLLLVVSVNRRRDNVGDRGEKVHVGDTEGPMSIGVRAENTELAAAAIDHHA